MLRQHNPIMNFLRRNSSSGKADGSLRNRLIKNFSIGFVGSIATAVIGMGRTALLTKLMAIADFGKIVIIQSLFELLSSFLSIRVNDVLFRFYPQFETEKNEDAQRALLYLSFALSLIVGMVIGIGVFLIAPWISVKFYNDAGLSSAFRIYAVAMLVSSFEGFNTAILRLHDRFRSLVVPQVVGTAVTFFFVVVYFVLTGVDYEIEWIVVAFAVGIILRSLVPLIIALRLVKPILDWGRKGNAFSALKPYRQKLVSNLFHTNLVGYLKIVSDRGGLFLLGVLSTPTEVAYFSIAKQLTMPLNLIKINIQNAVTPEITKLWLQQKISVLYSLIRRLVNSTAVWGGVLTVLFIIVAEPVLVFITTSDYVGAMPTFYLILVATYVNFISTSFYPLSVAMDRMLRRNVVVGLRLFYLGGAVFVGLNSFVLGVAHLIGVVSTRIFADLPLAWRLRRASQEEETDKNEQEEFSFDTTK